MAEFALPKNSRITGKARAHKAPYGSGRTKTFKIHRYDPDSGENPRYDLFEVDLESVTRGPAWMQTVEAWSAAPDGLLALTILLDQLPRNMYRGTARMYEHDVLALLVASRALGQPSQRNVTLVRRMFLVVPFMHAENMRRTSVASRWLACSRAREATSRANTSCSYIRAVPRYMFLGS